MKRFATLFAVVGLFALTGCNTVKGVGQDVQKAGSAIETQLSLIERIGEPNYLAQQLDKR